jgi:hypothetical protein
MSKGHFSSSASALRKRVFLALQRLAQLKRHQVILTLLKMAKALWLAQYTAGDSTKRQG